MLVDAAEYSSGFRIQNLIIPVRIDFRQLRSHPVMLSHPDGMQRSEARLFTRSIVTWRIEIDMSQKFPGNNRLDNFRLLFSTCVETYAIWTPALGVP